MGSNKYFEKVLIRSLRWNWYIIFRTSQGVQGFVLHVGWTSAKKINAFLDGKRQ